MVTAIDLEHGDDCGLGAGADPKPKMRKDTLSEREVELCQ
jgi:hypothetical protein